MCAKSDDSLDAWLKRHQDYTSWLIQNEIMSIMSNDIIRAICSDLQKAEPTQPGCVGSAFWRSVVVDGTRDVTGKEQESICVRYVTDDLFPAEAFLGFYEAVSTTGESLRRILLDVLCRLQLPVEKLRGQTFDGATNMSGAYNGTHALMKEVQPLPFLSIAVHTVLILSLKQRVQLHN